MNHYLHFYFLLDCDFPILRQFLIRADLTFADLHEAIQASAGWENRHPYWFAPFLKKKQGDAVICGPGVAGDRSILLASEIPLAKYGEFFSGTSTYVYDPTCSWSHTIYAPTLVELPDHFTRRLVLGRGTFPPEDCGGQAAFSKLKRICVTHGPKTKEDKVLYEAWCNWPGWGKGDFDLDAAKKLFDC